MISAAESFAQNLCKPLQPVQRVGRMARYLNIHQLNKAEFQLLVVVVVWQVSPFTFSNKKQSTQAERCLLMQQVSNV